MKIKFTQAIFLAISFEMAWAAPLVGSPSFDCSKASSNVEVAICSNKDLSEYDVSLSQNYKKWLQHSNDKEAEKRKQREWLKNERNICTDSVCIEKAYRKRLDEIKLDANHVEDSSISEVGQSNNADTVRPTASMPIAQTVTIQSPSILNNSPTPDVPASSVTIESQVSTNASITTPVALKIPEQNQTKPNSGISGIFSGVTALLTILFMIGLVKPKWILRWNKFPSRKKLAGYFFAIGIPFSILAQITKTDESKAYEAKIRSDQEAEDIRLAKEKTIEAKRITTAKNSDIHSLMSSEDFKMVCTEAGIFGMTYVDTKGKNLDTSGIYESIEDELKKYPPAMHPHIRNIWTKGLAFAEKNFDPRIYSDQGRLAEVAVTLGKGCQIALKNLGFIS